MKVFCLKATILSKVLHKRIHKQFQSNKFVFGSTKVIFLQVNAKYSEELASESLEWIKAITNADINTAGDMDNFYEVLKDGTLLCQ